MRSTHSITILASIPAKLNGLTAITSNLARLHDPRVLDLFREVDRHAIDITALDPLSIVSRCDQSKLDQLAANDEFVNRLNRLVQDLDSDDARTRWFDTRTDTPLQSVAYLSPEFGIAASVPQYSGGLGILAGDHLKAANDLGVPITGVGLFYRRGYFRQSLDKSHNQIETFPGQHPSMLTLRAVPDVEISIDLAGTTIKAQIWRADVGSVPLYLLDTTVDGETGSNQLVADRLYGGGTEDRIRQELLLGVGGFRALRAVGASPDVYHLNEGHAGFLVLEAIRCAMNEQGLSFLEAIEAVRPSIVFTTHTPVPAGIDRFPRELIERYLGWWCNACGVSLNDLMRLGSEDGIDTATFNLAAMSLRLAGVANGVSVLHGAVSRDMFSPIWPGVDAPDVPIRSVTNGVHATTWVSGEHAALLANSIGRDWAHANREAWANALTIPDADLWSVRSARRSKLVSFARQRATAAAVRRGARSSETRWCDQLLDPTILTLGFARRFATYKRATLLMRNPERLRKMLLDQARPVQLVFAGKAHPADEPGKGFIHQVAAFASDPALRNRIVFVEDYDIDAGRVLTQGADVWLNTPLRPMEACGTSGMKAAMNGALNCSVLDGWWDEMYTPEVGWAIPTDDDATDGNVRDDHESAWLFDLLENEVIPMFYERNANGVPSRWLSHVKKNLAELGPQVSASRMMRDYVTEQYEPAAARSAIAKTNHFEASRDLAAWRNSTTAAWPTVKVLEVLWPQDESGIGTALPVRVRVGLGSLNASDINVHVLVGPETSNGIVTDPTQITLYLADGDQSSDANSAWFSGELTTDHAGVLGAAVRVVPDHPGLHHWTDLRVVTWSSSEAPEH